MSLYSFGLQGVKSGEIDPVTGLPTNLTDIGPIYRDSMSFETADGDETEHYSELDQFPVITINEMGKTTYKMQLLDTSAVNLEKFCGGTVTSVAGQPDVWNSPQDIVDIEMALEITTKDGTVMTVNRAKVVGKAKFDPTRKGVHLIDVVFNILKPKVDGVPPFTITDNAPPA